MAARAKLSPPELAAELPAALRVSKCFVSEVFVAATRLGSLLDRCRPPEDEPMRADDAAALERCLGDEMRVLLGKLQLLCARFDGVGDWLAAVLAAVQLFARRGLLPPEMAAEWEQRAVAAFERLERAAVERAVGVGPSTTPAAAAAGLPPLLPDVFPPPVAARPEIVEYLASLPPARAAAALAAAEVSESPIAVGDSSSSEDSDAEAEAEAESEAAAEAAAAAPEQFSVVLLKGPSGFGVKVMQLVSGRVRVERVPYARCLPMLPLRRFPEGGGGGGDEAPVADGAANWELPLVPIDDQVPRDNEATGVLATMRAAGAAAAKAWLQAAANNEGPSAADDARAGSVAAVRAAAHEAQQCAPANRCQLLRQAAPVAPHAAVAAAERDVARARAGDNTLGPELGGLQGDELVRALETRAEFVRAAAAPPRGLQPNDIIVGLDGRDVRGEPLALVARYLAQVQWAVVVTVERRGPRSGGNLAGKAGEGAGGAGGKAGAAGKAGAGTGRRRAASGGDSSGAGAASASASARKRRRR